MSHREIEYFSQACATSKWQGQVLTPHCSPAHLCSPYTVNHPLPARQRKRGAHGSSSSVGGEKAADLGCVLKILMAELLNNLSGGWVREKKDIKDDSKLGA